jgi:hypothetical protein
LLCYATDNVTGDRVHDVPCSGPQLVFDVPKSGSAPVEGPLRRTVIGLGGSRGVHWKVDA